MNVFISPFPVTSSPVIFHRERIRAAYREFYLLNVIINASKSVFARLVL